ncbi:MAG: hypothetical protein ABSH39_18750 [Candidatus Acidiferrum sp.]
MIPIRSLVKGIVIAIVVAVVLTYLGDYISVRMRMKHSTANDPFETITALRILAIDEKGNKTEYSVDTINPQQTGTCVHSLFPHYGDPPCWYLKKKFAQPIPMAIFLFPKRQR